MKLDTSSSPHDSFYDNQRDNLRSLFEVLGRQKQWSEDLDGLVDYTQATWVGAEHDDATKDSYTEEQEAAAKPILKTMGMYDEQLPEPGQTFDQLAVIGGLMSANYRRLKFLEHLQASQHFSLSGPVVFWAGQRLRVAREADGQTDLVDPAGRYPGYEVADNAWVKRQMARPWEADSPWERAFSTETELARLAVHKVYGPDLQPHRITIDIEPKSKLPTVASRNVRDSRFMLPGDQELILMNGAAIARKGENRHTTASCAEESFEFYPLPENGRVLLLTGNPHTLRTTRVVKTVLEEAGREDVEVVPLGTSAPAHASVPYVLGEVGMLLYEDQRRLQLASVSS
jgi:hypothetical protein